MSEHDEQPGGYPHHLAGDPVPPPAPVDARTFGMAMRVYERQLAAAPPEPDVDELFGARPWRTAGSIDVLFAEANTAAPDRARGSDGRIGDARHAALGSKTDHNPWLVHRGEGIVRAGDITNDPALQLAAAFERARARAAAAAGRLPQLVDGGYLIINGAITAPDFSRWLEYTGDNPHVRAGHASVSRNPAQFDSRAPWGLFTAAAPSAPSAPPSGPAAAAPAGWTGPDLQGAGAGLRGDEGNNGPRVQGWQRYLAENYPAYRHALGDLEPDGWWGPITTSWNREFGQRSGITSADGLNIGPKLAAAYWRAGLFRTLSAARLRAARHPARGARR